MPSTTESFPQLVSSAKQDKLTPLNAPSSIETPRIRRRSSGLGGEIRAGDTGAPAFATVDVRPPSPGTIKVSTFYSLFSLLRMIADTDGCIGI